MANDYNITGNSIDDLFGNSRTYTIPNYQRRYEWKKDDAVQLLNDLLEMSSNEGLSTDNLLGAIVVVKGDDGIDYEVVDGQQRLATLSLIFCAIRTCLQKFKEATNPDQKLVIDDALNKLDDLLMIKNKSSKNNIRVELGDSDSPLFREIIHNKNPDYKTVCKSLIIKYETGKKRIEESHARLIDNYRQLCDRTKKWLKNDFGLDDATENYDSHRLSQAVLSLRNRVEHIAKHNDFAFIVAPDKNHAYRIFNTFNARGQKLNQADLIKSHLLSVVGKDRSSSKLVERWWPKIFDADLEEDPDKFLYESISSRNPSGRIKNIKITEKNLYQIIHSQVKTLDDVKACLEHLKEDAKFIKYMDHPEDLPVGQQYDKIKSQFYGIKTLGARYIRVPILAAYRRWDDNVTAHEFQDLVECLLVFFFKFKHINDGTAEDVRSIATKVTQLIAAGKPISTIIYKILVDEDVQGGPTKRISDKIFNENFKKKMYNVQRDVAKYILASIEIWQRCENNKETRTHIEYNFELEHILPKRHKEIDWPAEKFLDDSNGDKSMNKYKERLGNLTILSSKWNRGLAAKNFAKKRDDKSGYANSDFLINRYLKNCPEWTATNLEERENNLAEVAKNVWSLEKYDTYLKEHGYKV